MNSARYAWDFSFLWGYRFLILKGLGVTIAYTIGTILLGLVVGLVAGLLRLSRNPLITAPLLAYVEIFRCTPLLVQIVWFYYALPVVSASTSPPMSPRPWCSRSTPAPFTGWARRLGWSRAHDKIIGSLGAFWR
jgi:polar amino acid transport system permease protein